LAVCVAVLGFGGCGGGSDASTTASTTQDTTKATPQPAKRATTATPREKAKQTKSLAPSTPTSSEQSNDSKQSSTKPVKVPAISSAPKAGSKAPAPGVKTVPGGDNSVQEYGVEADESERREAAIALQGYLNARAREDWAAACSLLAQRPKEQLEKFAGSGGAQGKGLEGCAAAMAALGEGTPQDATITEVLSFRGEGDISGDPSYLIFTAPPGQTLFSMPMYLQGGAWKVGLAQASELPV
jgi:hypothetical protein